MDRVEDATHPEKGAQIQVEFRGCVSGARSKGMRATMNRRGEVRLNKKKLSLNQMS